MRGAGRGWGDFFWKIPRRGRGREVVCGEFGGGAKYFLFGAEMSTKFVLR